MSDMQSLNILVTSDDMVTVIVTSHRDTWKDVEGSGR